MGVKRHPELTLWRHQELTPLVLMAMPPLTERVAHGVHRGDPRIAERPPRVWRSNARGVPVGPRGRAAVQVRTVVMPAFARTRPAF